MAVALPWLPMHVPHRNFHHWLACIQRGYFRNRYSIIGIVLCNIFTILICCSLYSNLSLCMHLGSYTSVSICNLPYYLTY
jgi:hypothetical protein